MRNQDTTTTRLAKGALAGTAGVWAMDRADWFMVRQQDPRAWQRTQAVRPHGKDPAHNLVDMVGARFGAAPRPQPNALGIATHYAVGVLPAAVYATLALRRRIGPASGPLFGLLMGTLVDELFNPAIGAAAPARRYPWQAHARGVVAHLVYGAVTELALRALDRRGAGRSG